MFQELEAVCIPETEPGDRGTEPVQTPPRHVPGDSRALRNPGPGAQGPCGFLWLWLLVIGPEGQGSRLPSWPCDPGQPRRPGASGLKVQLSPAQVSSLALQLS